MMIQTEKRDYFFNLNNKSKSVLAH